MTRWCIFWAILSAFSGSTVVGQQEKPPAQQQPQQQPQEQEPPEEDVSLKPKDYAFNPLQAQKELRIGNYYFKKGSYKAATNRFREATRWDPTSAESFLRLGEAEEKSHNKKAAREAFLKYLELAPDGKEAVAVKKKVGIQ